MDTSKRNQVTLRRGEPDRSHLGIKMGLMRSGSRRFVSFDSAQIEFRKLTAPSTEDPGLKPQSQSVVQKQRSQGPTGRERDLGTVKV